MSQGIDPEPEDAHPLPSEPADALPSQPSARPPFDRLAVASLWLTVLVPPVGMIVADLAFRRIARSGQRGWGLAMTAMVVGFYLTIVWGATILILIWVAKHPGTG